jgi:hypothetical protein
MPDFQTTCVRSARKVHRCCECNGYINPGQQYQLCSGSWDGQMDSFKTCSVCLAAREWATAQPEWASDGEHLYYFGRLPEDLANLVPEIPVGDGRRFRCLRHRALMRKQWLNRAKAA